MIKIKIKNEIIIIIACTPYFEKINWNILTRFVFKYSRKLH